LYKKGCRADCSNYRPVEHFTANKFFSSKQFGFIKGRSTTLQLLQILDIWTKCLEQGGQIDVVYTDLEKALDKYHIKD